MNADTISTLAKMYESLHDAGFSVAVNEAHTRITVSLNRSISKMEVWMALGQAGDYARISRIDANTIVVTE